MSARVAVAKPGDLVSDDRSCRSVDSVREVNMANREIKFRVWDVDGTEMSETFDLSYSTLFFRKRSVVVEIHHAFSRPDEFVFMQFTGLKDKHGVEIYEGDILHLYYPYKFYGEVHKELKTVQVRFENGSFWFDGGGITDCNWHFYNHSDREVIGNIYDNPGTS
jgi:uncharacterized phage protein (TIGR01671 family)